jgi:hypothetical protein
VGISVGNGAGGATGAGGTVFGGPGGEVGTPGGSSGAGSGMKSPNLLGEELVSQTRCRVGD